MVSEAYLREYSAPPGATTRFLHQQAIPAAIDGLAAGEAVLEAAAQRVRAQPAIGLGVAFGVGLLLSMMLLPRRS